MLIVLRRLKFVFRKKSEKEKKLAAAVFQIVGSKPINISPYLLATQHTSVAKERMKGFKESNERLEYLGDAILGSIIAEYLFKKFPFKDEGFLTEMRARIVNREALNGVSKKMGVANIVEFDSNRRNALSHKSIYGDTLEAFVGAVYLDRGYKFTRRFVLRKIFQPHYDLDELMTTNYNHKSLIIEWAQKESKEVKFEIIEVKNNKHYKEFVAQLYVDNKPISKGAGFTKKKAEQAAAMKSCEILSLTGD